MRTTSRIAAAAIGILAVALIGLAAYYFFAPAPAMPHLDGAATRGEIRVSGRYRRYLAYVPAHLPRDAPLVLVLHGSFMDGAMRSALATAKYFVAANGLTAPPQRSRLPGAPPGDPTLVDRTVWSRDGVPMVAFYQISGGGHVVPQPVYRWPRFLGLTSKQFNAPAAIWNFFTNGAVTD